MFFSKTEYKELELPFVCDINPDDLYAGVVNIEAYGDVFGEIKYCYASFYVNVNDVDELATLLSNSFNNRVNVIFKIKNGKVKSFKIDLESLARIFNDNRFKKIELMGWGINDRSFRELGMFS